MPQKTALITGITGQDGAVLAQILLDKGYTVHGMRPYSAVPDTARVDGLDITLYYGDVTDGGAILRLLETLKPDEIYNLAGMSHVHVSFDMPELTANVNGLGPLRFLEAMRLMNAQKDMRFYQASSSEMYGRAPAPQHEQTPFEPCSPYGASKLYAYFMVRQYREAYGLYACNGILFNHESALRGEEFVTRKITQSIGKIEAGLRDKISLGNLDAKRDWGHAHDYMRGAWAMLQQKTPDDYVLATGQSYSVRDFVAKAFAVIGVDIIWQGAGLNELGINKQTGQTMIDIDPALFRPTEIHNLIGDASKAKRLLNWTPRHSFDDLVTEMVQADRLVQNAAPIKYGT